MLLINDELVVEFAEFSLSKQVRRKQAWHELRAMMLDKVSKVNVDKKGCFPFPMDTRCVGLKGMPNKNESVRSWASPGLSRAVSQWDDVDILGRNMLDYVDSWELQTI